MGNFSMSEMLVIAVFALIIFGPRRLPEIARSAGRALREFRHVTGELTEELKAGFDEPAVHPMPATSLPKKEGGVRGGVWPPSHTVASHEPELPPEEKEQPFGKDG